MPIPSTKGLTNLCKQLSYRDECWRCLSFFKNELANYSHFGIVNYPSSLAFTEAFPVELNKYQAIIISKLVSEALRNINDEPGSLEYGMLLELEQNLSTFLLNDIETPVNWVVLVGNPDLLPKLAQLRAALVDQQHVD